MLTYAKHIVHGTQVKN